MKNADIKSKQTILISIGIIGILLLIIGIIIREEKILIKTFLIAIGGSVFGASMSNLISFIGFNLFDFVKGSLTIPYINKGEEISVYRQKYYCYYISSVNDSIGWRMYQISYQNLKSANYLSGDYIVKSDGNDGLKYSEIGLVLEDRFVTISKAAKGNQNPSIYIFPKFTTEFNTYSVGLGIIEDWDSNDMYSPMIISKKPIKGHKENGKIVDQELIKELNERVDKKLKNLLWTKE